MARMQRPLKPVMLSVLCLLLGACTLLDGDDQGSSATEPPATAETTAPAPDDSPEPDSSRGVAPETTVEEFFVPESEPGELFELLGPEDRIVVQSADNNLSLLTFAGEVPGPTANDANQPVFSPDGSVLAWTTLRGGSEAGVAFSDLDQF